MTDEREELAKLLELLRSAAEKLHLEYMAADCRIDNSWGSPRSAELLMPYIQQRVDAAVKAERERCAETARSHNERGDHIHYPGTCGVSIAAAIRSGEGK